MAREFTSLANIIMGMASFQRVPKFWINSSNKKNHQLSIGASYCGCFSAGVGLRLWRRKYPWTCITGDYQLLNIHPYTRPSAVCTVLCRHPIEFLSRGFCRTQECRKNKHSDIRSRMLPARTVDLQASEKLKGSSLTMIPEQIQSKIFS